MYFLVLPRAVGECRLPEINVLVLTGTVLTVTGLLRSMFLLGAGSLF